MPFPIRICAVCSEEFELRPDKPGFANRCPACSEPEDVSAGSDPMLSAVDSKHEVNAARRRAMYDLLYRKET
jgi:hypothetical protein